jgi:hypothetical protein
VNSEPLLTGIEMTRRIRVLSLPPKEEGRDHLQRDVVAAVGPKHDLKMFDRAPLAPEFEGIDFTRCLLLMIQLPGKLSKKLITSRVSRASRRNC